MDSSMTVNPALEFLKQNRLVAFATISAEKSSPQAAFVYYITDENHHIFIATEKHSQKITNITANPHVALVLGQEEEPKTLQIEGTAALVTDVQQEENLIAQYADIANKNKSDSMPPLLHLSLDTGMTFLDITITHFKFSDFSQPKKQIIEGTPADW